MRIKQKEVYGFAAVFCVLVLSGCSASFAGIPIGDREELAFSCDAPPAALQQAESGPEVSAEEPSKAAEPQTETVEEEGEAVDGTVNINTAGMEELMTLNGIGETRAKAIIAYREENGPFAKAEDLMQISGIKEGVFSKIKAQIRVQ